MTMRITLYSVAFSSIPCFAMLAGPACADMKDLLSTADTTEITSQGMRSGTGEIFSQGMMAKSGSWAEEIYSQGMMMSTGDIYSQGMEITILGGTTDSQGTDAIADLGGTTNFQGTGRFTNLGATTNSPGTGGVTNLGATANSRIPAASPTSGGRRIRRRLAKGVSAPRPIAPTTSQTWRQS
jgi:hypothetical protein